MRTLALLVILRILQFICELTSSHLKDEISFMKPGLSWTIYLIMAGLMITINLVVACLFMWLFQVIFVAYHTICILALLTIRPVFTVLFANLK